MVPLILPREFLPDVLSDLLYGEKRTPFNDCVDISYSKKAISNDYVFNNAIELIRSYDESSYQFLCKNKIHFRNNYLHILKPNSAAGVLPPLPEIYLNNFHIEDSVVLSVLMYHELSHLMVGMNSCAEIDTISKEVEYIYWLESEGIISHNDVAHLEEMKWEDILPKYDFYHICPAYWDKEGLIIDDINQKK